jgi:hypothetical protein
VARALALTAECLTCAEGDTSTKPGLDLPTVLPRQPNIIPGVPGNDDRTLSTPGSTQQPVTVGTSEIPSSGTGPTVQLPPPSEASGGIPWRKVGLGLAVIVGILLLTAPVDRGRSE